MAIYHQNFPTHVCVGDVLDVSANDIAPHDILTAGFPCQPFTTRGHQKGLDDDRGQLYRELVRILVETQPNPNGSSLRMWWGW
mmetsp:Transcript_55466/g.66803  ORF Transcript_55466/g.66803 Transcript_55466/m.66803 type:complete len:83 (-) Transcript_55466:42-290(-)